MLAVLEQRHRANSKCDRGKSNSHRRQQNPKEHTTPFNIVVLRASACRRRSSVSDDRYRAERTSQARFFFFSLSPFFFFFFGDATTPTHAKTRRTTMLNEVHVPLGSVDGDGCGFCRDRTWKMSRGGAVPKPPRQPPSCGESVKSGS